MGPDSCQRPALALVPARFRSHFPTGVERYMHDPGGFRVSDSNRSHARGSGGHVTLSERTLLPLEQLTAIGVSHRAAPRAVL